MKHIGSETVLAAFGESATELVGLAQQLVAHGQLAVDRPGFDEIAEGG